MSCYLSSGVHAYVWISNGQSILVLEDTWIKNCTAMYWNLVRGLCWNLKYLLETILECTGYSGKKGYPVGIYVKFANE